MWIMFGISNGRLGLQQIVYLDGNLMNWNDHIGKQYIFTAQYKLNQRGKMLLLDVRRQDGELLREHLLIPYTRRFKKQALKRGDTLTLRGKVNRYYKKPPDEKHAYRNPKTLIAKIQITNIHIIHIERKHHE
ncbi:hypothetical protein C8B47_03690 [filamentous cyanobacterium CCP4]|nr:hypothetical protein C8B47_03690 [filamentous cyanobacterium CCP4]